MSRETQEMIGEMTGATISCRGVHVPAGMRAPAGERKQYLLIEGPTEQVVRRGKHEIKKILEEYTEKALRTDGVAMGRYKL